MSPPVDRASNRSPDEARASENAAASLKQQLYLAPKLGSGVGPPRLTPQSKWQNAASSARLVSPTKLLPPLEASVGQEKAGRLKSSLTLLGAKEPAIPGTPDSPKQPLAPLQRKPGLIAVPALRATTKPKPGLSIEPGHDVDGRKGVLSPQLSVYRHVSSPKGRSSSLVLPDSPMAPQSPGSPTRPNAFKASTQEPKQQTAAAQPSSTAAASDVTRQQAVQTQLAQEEYKYMKLISTLREYPTTEDFVYLKRFDKNVAEYNPYALEVVQFANLHQADYYTISVRGMTHYINGTSAEFTSLDQWEREVHLFIALKQLALFKLHKEWKAFRTWKRAINTVKINAAKAALVKNLFLLSPVFQGPLQQFHELCHELSHLRLHSLKQGEVYTLDSFTEEHMKQFENSQQQLADFSVSIHDVVQEACIHSLEQLEMHLETFRIKQIDGDANNMEDSTMKRSPRDNTMMPSTTGRDNSQQDFAYTMAAARRSEQRRLINFVRVSDYMMCDTLHTILVESVRDVLEATKPAPQRMSLSRNSSTRGVSVMSQASSPEPGQAPRCRTPSSSQEVAQQGPPCMPVFEVEVLLDDSADDLVFVPAPEEFQSQMMSILSNFMVCVTSIQRLYGQPHLVQNVLGAKLSDLEEATPLNELVTSGDYEELVECVKNALDVSFSRAHLQKSAYIPYQEMAAFDRQLDITALGPAFREKPRAADTQNNSTDLQASTSMILPTSTSTVDIQDLTITQVTEGPVTLDTFRQLMSLLAKQRAEIEALQPFADVDTIRVDVKRLQRALLPWPSSRLDEMHRLLPHLAAELFQDFMSKVQAAASGLSAPCTTVEDYVNKITFLGQLQSQEKDFEAACNEIHALYALLEEFKIAVSDVDKAGYATLDNAFAALKNLMEEVNDAREEAISKYSTELESGVENIGKEVTLLRNAAQNDLFLSEEASHDMVVEELKQLTVQLEKLTEEVANINQYQKQFKVAESHCDELGETLEEVKLKLALWDGNVEFAELVDAWRAQQFEQLDVTTMEEAVSRFHKLVFRMERGLPPNKLVPKLRAGVDEYRGLLPVITALRNKALKERHWSKVYEAVQTTLPRDETFTLQVLIDAKVSGVKDIISTISTEATQEATLEELLANVVSKWASIEFNIVPYKDSKDVFIMGSTDDIQVALEDSLVTMSTILSSRFVGGIRAEVERVEKQLNIFSDTLDQWVQVQKSWMYLEPIFSAPDMTKQLPIETKAFEVVHKQLKDIMRKTKDRPNALATASNPGLLEMLTKIFDTLEGIQKSLEEYLETKRVAFPRFYFLSNDELLEILAQTKNVQAVQPHMGKCFDGIRRLDFGDDPKSLDIYAMISGEGERVSLGKNPVKARGNVENWLGHVESAMVASLRRLAKSGAASYPEEPRSEWVLNQPAQLVIAVSQVYWCAAVEEHLRGSKAAERLETFYKVNVQQLGELTQLVRGELSNLSRRVLAALITIDVHARDIVAALLSKHTSSVNDFEWQMQLRYYFENEDLVVRQVNASFLYAYEYLGAQPRLVVTPMTDRCYLTLTGALHLRLGGAPAGPAGTGKTETTKDLGKALGVNCVVFNCGDNLDYKFMGKFFSGLAQCGAWACFDEFNRIDVEVLSVVAQQLLTIQNALKAGMDKFWFEGRPIRLVPTCGVFITMNPGYAGRTELPDNLKALFRPMAMMIPDYALVAEVMLFSEGFEDSKVLSKKMVKLYKLASEQLSQQDHYDFGMRAVKSVLVMAGTLKRANPDLPEDVVLIRAMRDSNLPKFLVHDVELFCNIIGDLFPGVAVPDQDYGELAQNIRSVMSSKGLQQPPAFVSKVVQLYDTMNVRFGVMLVGPTGGGKTNCYQTLQGALTRLRQEVQHPDDKFQVTHTYTFNPKCIKMGELYGEYNLLTNEWTDGLGSTLIRSAVNDTTPDKKWVVFDGPVDAVWIENMNTVLDDNCTLCLPNAERIKLNGTTMRMLFEVQDLAVASPATVSRCGMVYIASEELGWRPAIQTWIERTLPQAVPALSATQCQHIYTLFDMYVDRGLAWVHQHGKEYIPSVDNNLTTSLACMLQSLLDPARGFKLDVSQEAFEVAIGRLFGFAYVWSLGGNVGHTARDDFDEFVRELFQQVVTFPGGGLVYDYQVNLKVSPPELKQWSDSVPSFTYNKSLPYFQMLVPTVDTVRFSYLLECYLDVQRSVLFTGVTGVGKSIISTAALEQMCEHKGLIPQTIVFSAQTSSLDTQLVMESKLEKKRKTRYGAPVNKCIVFFIDDINMPAREKYGAQPPIELLRQFQDFKGFYDRKKLFWKEIEDTVLCGACAPPGGGRQEVTPRFLRHFSMLCIPPPSDASTKTILSSILGGFLADFPTDVKALGSSVVNASVEAYNRISEELLPTPAKSHYTFNLRDLSKVFQGLLMAKPGTCSSREALSRLWVHEACRVFHDRLVSTEDKDYFKKMLVELVNKHGLASANYDGLFGQHSIMWGDFMRPEVERADKQYEEITDTVKLGRILEDYLDDYNLNHTSGMNLVFFQDAIEHIARIARVLRQPLGNAMLAGIGGSGKQSLTRFAAHMGGFQTYQIELMRGYGAVDFREDLKKMYRAAGVDGEPVVFLFSDTQIVEEGFLEDINNLLNSGEVPGMFAAEEKDRIVNDVREWVTERGGNPSKDGCWAAFINRVRDNLHVVLTMSPVGDAFRARCRQFPSLINCCTIDWFSQWPSEALLSVSQKFLALTDLGSDAVRDAIAQMCVQIHTSVEAMSARFYAELSRRYYTTPKSYLDLISLYLQLLKEKRDEYSVARDRLLNGLSKLNETNALVDKMKLDLAALQPVLEAKAAATAELLAKVTADQEEAEKVKVVVASEEKEVKEIATKTQAMADEAKADLEEAMPALNAAIDSLKALNKNDIVEIKSFPKPPPLVQMTMEAVCILKQEKPDWDTAKRVLGDTNFMKSLEEFDKDNIPEPVIKKLKKYIDDPQYQPDVVAKQSRAAMSLCMWSRAMDVYNRVAKVVGPKRQKLAEAEASLADANTKLQEKQDSLAQVISRVDGLKKQLSEAQSEQRLLTDQAELTRKRLERAGKLTSGLADEGVRWQQTADQIQQQTNLLVGDVFLSAACIAYYGAFTGAYREHLVSSWISSCQALGIPVSADCTLRGTLASPVEVREWNMAGLPTDGVSVDNGILVTRGKRWPLMIDPQGQANSWVKAMDMRNGLRVIKLSDANFLRTLENCIRVGNPALIEDVGEKLDPALEPVLQRAVFKQGGRLLIRLGDADVDYDPSFRLYITTKLANPHYLPEICIKVTLINFTVTMRGLEDQLLGEVVRKERPELEEQRDRLVVSIAADKRQLKELEDKILKLLRESEGNILDDEQLIATLNNSKLTSAAIQNRVKEAEETERSINAARESYRPAATRGSILYFVIADLASINPMYQFSLAYFIRMFSHCIDNSAKNEDVTTRLETLSEYVTLFVYKNVSRGLFEEHKLLYSFLMCTSILRHPSSADISDPEWSFLMRGPVGLSSATAASKHNPAPAWITDSMWKGLLFVDHAIPAMHGLADSFTSDTAAWQKWVNADEPHQAPLPAGWHSKLGDAFGRLLLLKIFKEEKLVFGCQQYVAHKLGKSFTEPPPWSLDDVFPETNERTPIIFILSTGADPTAMLQRFAERKGWTVGQRLHMISLGQGQGVIAENMMKQAASTGDWVCLQNCHLAASWMLRLEEKVEELSREGSHVHPDFRLWLTSMPAAVFPVPVLQNGIKLTNEPPKGVKANIGRTYNDLTNEVLESCPAKPSAWRRLLCSLSFFHAVVQERRKFGPLGWNIRYEFNASDLECSSSTLRMFLTEQEHIPWDALEYVIGQINYGGRVTDDLDRRCLMSVLRQYVAVRVVESDGCRLTSSGTYKILADGDVQTYRDYIRGLPSTEAPEVFGMHANANIAFQLQETRKLMQSILSIQPRLGGGGGGDGSGGVSSTDDIVGQLAADILTSLPPDLDLSEALPGLFDRTPAGQLNSLSVVLGQEVDRFRRLAAVLRSSLAELQKAIKGQVVMSAELEAMYTALINNQVPELWSAVAYPSLKPLASWVKDYHQRISFMRDWLTAGVPKCFWLPGFFFPQGFMTGVLQMHARKYSIPIDTLSFGFQVTQHLDVASLPSAPEDGIYINGLWIDGARWNMSQGCLEESEPGVMYAPLPIVHFQPMQDYVMPKDQYECPLYKTSARAGVLSTTGQSTNFVLCVSLPVKPGTDSDVWVLQGVALLCMLKD